MRARLKSIKRQMKMFILCWRNNVEGMMMMMMIIMIMMIMMMMMMMMT